MRLVCGVGVSWVVFIGCFLFLMIVVAGMLGVLVAIGWIGVWLVIVRDVVGWVVNILVTVVGLVVLVGWGWVVLWLFIVLVG